MAVIRERGYEHCRAVFGHAPSTRIYCDLTPGLLGATGFATTASRTPRIGVRRTSGSSISPWRIIFSTISRV